MRGRFLHQFQQSVEAGRGHHVGLVHDVDLVPAGDRGEEGALPEITGVLHPAVGGGVDLDDVDAAGPASCQVGARITHPARRGRGALLAVEAARQDAGGRGLAAAAGAGEQVGVVHLVVVQCPLQRDGDVILPDHLGERVGAVAAVEGQGRGRRVGGLRRTIACSVDGGGGQPRGLLVGGSVLGRFDVVGVVEEPGAVLLRCLVDAVVGLQVTEQIGTVLGDGLDGRIVRHPVPVTDGAVLVLKVLVHGGQPMPAH